MLRIVTCLENKEGGEKVAICELFESTKKIKKTIKVQLVIHNIQPYSKHTIYFISTLFFWIKHFTLHKYNFIVLTSHYQFLPSLLQQAKKAYFFHSDKSFSLNKIDKSQQNTSQRFFSYLWYKFNNTLFTLTLKHATIIFVPHYETQLYVQKIYRFTQGKEFCIIPNGIDHRKFFPISTLQKRKLKIKLHLPENKILLSYIGRIDPLKNIHLLFYSIQQLPSILHLQIVHPPLISPEEKKYFQKLEMLNKKINCTESVSFIESRYKIIEQFYQASDLVILPSSQEQSSQVLKEATSCGIPVISTNTGDFSQLFPEYPSSLVIQKINEVEVFTCVNFFLNSNRQFKKRLSSYLERESSSFQWNSSAQKYIFQCTKILEKSRR